MLTSLIAWLRGFLWLMQRKISHKTKEQISPKLTCDRVERWLGYPAQPLTPLAPFNMCLAIILGIWPWIRSVFSDSTKVLGVRLQSHLVRLGISR